MKIHKNHLRLLILLLLVLLACAGYMTVGVHFENQKLFAYAMRIRTPKLIAMLITAFAIGSASIVFQSIINNTIVTPCLLGMDQLYSLIHTAVFFVAGSGSFLAVNANAAFAVDLAIMGAVATVIYSYLFRKTNHNVLYVLLIGTVLTSFFSSIQTTLTRVMDPNEYDTLLTDLVASFSNVNSAILVLSVAVLALVAFAFRKELALLDVLTLGKDQAINLGVDYDRCIRRLLLGGHAVHCNSHRYGRAAGISGAYHCQPFPAVPAHLPAQPAHHRLCFVRYGCSDRRTASGGAGVRLLGSGQCVHHRGRRRVFPVSAAHPEKGITPCL